MRQAELTGKGDIMKEYIFFYEKIVVGGAETLIGRISKYMVQNNIPVKICCRSIDENMLRYFQEINAEVYKLENWDSDRELSKWLKRFEEPRIIVMIWEDFVRVYSLRGINAKTMFYVGHYMGLAVGNTCRYKVLKKIIRNIGAKCLYRFLAKKNIVCMDNMTVRYTKDYFNNNLLNDESIYSIVRIPVDINTFNYENIAKKDDRKINIMTVARAEFPFKGYLLGMIDFAEKLSDIGEDLHIDIVSYGPDINELKEKINKFAGRKSIISLHGKTDYQELENYYKNTNLYIGMDTTILDAASKGIVSIPVAPYTEELLADKFFHDDYRELRAEKDCDNNIEQLYMTVCNMKTEEYDELSKKIRELIIKYYSTEVNVPKLVKQFDIIGKNKFNIIILFFYCMNKVQNILNRKEKIKNEFKA